MRAKAEKPIPRICHSCGVVFWIAPSRLRNNPTQGRWHSMACRNKKGGWTASKGHRKAAITDDQIVAEYQNGAGVVTMMGKYNISCQPIYKALRKSGIELRGSEGMNTWSPEKRQRKSEQSRQLWIENNPNKRDDLPFDAIGEAYRNGESSAHIAARYKCSPDIVIDHARLAGIPIRPSGYVPRVLCDDGHIADSQWEADIDNWLMTHNIEHTIHPRVPWYTPATKGHGDFLAGDTYIEVWGMYGNARYDRRCEYKISQYQSCGAKLIQIFPHHLISQNFTPLEALLV